MSGQVVTNALLLLLSILPFVAAQSLLPAVLSLALLAGFCIYRLGDQWNRAMKLRRGDLRYLWLPLAEFAVLGVLSLAVEGSLFSGSGGGFLAWVNELANCVLIALREELTTTFGLMILVGALFRRFTRGEAFTKRQMQGIVVLSALIFGLIHLFNLREYLAYYRQGLIDWATVAVFSVLNPLNAFILGICIKAIYVKTGSLPLCMLLHFLLNIVRRNILLLHGRHLIFATVPLLAVYLLYGLWLLHTLPAENALE